MSIIGKNISFQEAQNQARQNKRRIFTSKAGDGNSGFERITRGDFPDIEVKPKFQLSPNASFFTIGSCFARNVENALKSIGANVLSARYSIPEQYYEAEGLGARNGALNVYTAHSMMDILRLRERRDAETAAMLEVGNGEVCDMLLSGLKIMPEDTAREIRCNVLDVYSSLTDADCVVMTLGYTESWGDIQDDIFVNRSPAGSLRTSKRGDRYAFFNAGATEIEGALESALHTIHNLTKGRAKVILTVSPVPLHATFTGRDVISANLYSKCALVAASVATASRHDHVDYFPSYELVSYSPKENAWKDDGVHVQQAMVARIMETFRNLYF